MTNRQLWLATQGAEFLAGYDAACANLPDDRDGGADWRRGYLAALQDIDHGDYDPSQLSQNI